MANKKTRVLSNEEYELLIKTITEGFKDSDDRIIKPNKKVAMALIIEANLGVRIGDAVNLKLRDFITVNGKYRLNIIETKTRKERTFSIPGEVYIFIQSYAIEMGIARDQRLVELTERQVQRHLKQAADHLGLEDVSTHSFRKFYATSMFYENDQNFELVRFLLQHSSLAITQRYLGVDSKVVEKALDKHIKLPA